MNEATQQIVQSLNWADYAIMAIVGLSIIISFARGFVKEALSLGTWIVAIYVGIKFYTPVSAMMIHYVTTPSVRMVIAFGALFLGTILVGGTLNFLLSHLITKTGLSAPNRLLGGLFGFARGMLLVGLIVMLGRQTALPQDPWWQTAMLIPYGERIADTIDKFIPEKVHQISALISGSPLSQG